MRITQTATHTTINDTPYTREWRNGECWLTELDKTEAQAVQDAIDAEPPTSAPTEE